MKTLQLTLTVTYNPEGVPLSDLKTMLEEVAFAAAGNGLLTGDTPATVEHWTHKVEEIATPAAQLA